MASRTLRLRHLSPSQLTAILAPTKSETASLLQGIDCFSSDDVTGRITISGEPEAVRNFEKLASLVDKQPKQFVAHVRLVYTAKDLDRVGIDWRIMPAKFGSTYAFAADVPSQKDLSVEVTSEARVRVSSNVPTSALLFGRNKLLNVSVVGHVNGDGTFSLSVETSDADGKSCTGFRRLKSDRVMLMGGFNEIPSRNGNLYLMIGVQPVR